VLEMPKFQFYFETMAGTHLADSVRALRDSGSADTLYDPSLSATSPGDIEYDDFSVARDIAEGERVTYSRRALLFAAFAAEAYANDFLYEKWDGKDRDALQRFSTVDKFALLPTMAGVTTVLDRGREPLQRLRWLFRRRDELVHAAPLGRDLTYDPANHNPRAAAESIVAVADAVTALTGMVPDGSVLSCVVTERARLLEYGGRAADELPRIHEPPSPVDLLVDARQRDWS
jgi:hypothetical protein